MPHDAVPTPPVASVPGGLLPLLDRLGEGQAGELQTELGLARLTRRDGVVHLQLMVSADVSVDWCDLAPWPQAVTAERGPGGVRFSVTMPAHADAVRVVWQQLTLCMRAVDAGQFWLGLPAPEALGGRQIPEHDFVWAETFAMAGVRSDFGALVTPSLRRMLALAPARFDTEVFTGDGVPYGTLGHLLIEALLEQRPGVPLAAEVFLTRADAGGLEWRTHAGVPIEVALVDDAGVMDWAFAAVRWGRRHQRVHLTRLLLESLATRIRLHQSLPELSSAFWHDPDTTGLWILCSRLGLSERFAGLLMPADMAPGDTGWHGLVVPPLADATLALLPVALGPVEDLVAILAWQESPQDLWEVSGHPSDSAIAAMPHGVAHSTLDDGPWQPLDAEWEERAAELAAVCHWDAWCDSAGLWRAARLLAVHEGAHPRRTRLTTSSRETRGFEQGVADMSRRPGPGAGERFQVAPRHVTAALSVLLPDVALEELGQLGANVHALQAARAYWERLLSDEEAGALWAVALFPPELVPVPRSWGLREVDVPAALARVAIDAAQVRALVDAWWLFRAVMAPVLKAVGVALPLMAPPLATAGLQALVDAMGEARAFRRLLEEALRALHVSDLLIATTGYSLRHLARTTEEVAAHLLGAAALMPRIDVLPAWQPPLLLPALEFEGFPDALSTVEADDHAPEGGSASAGTPDRDGLESTELTFLQEIAQADAARRHPHDEARPSSPFEMVAQRLETAIVGHRETLRHVALLGWLHATGTGTRQRVLAVGHAGAGKLRTFLTLGDFLDLPVVVVEGRDLLESAGHGATLATIGDRVVAAARHHLVARGQTSPSRGAIAEVARRAVVYFDGLDLIRHDVSLTQDQQTIRSYQQLALLALVGSAMPLRGRAEMEDLISAAEVTAQATDEQLTYEIPTEDLLIVCAGSFPGLGRDAVRPGAEALVAYGLDAELIDCLNERLWFGPRTATELAQLLATAEHGVEATLAPAFAVHGWRFLVAPETYRAAAHALVQATPDIGPRDAIGRLVAVGKQRLLRALETRPPAGTQILLVPDDLAAAGFLDRT